MQASSTINIKLVYHKWQIHTISLLWTTIKLIKTQRLINKFKITDRDQKRTYWGSRLTSVSCCHIGVALVVKVAMLRESHESYSKRLSYNPKNETWIVNRFVMRLLDSGLELDQYLELQVRAVCAYRSEVKSGLQRRFRSKVACRSGPKQL